MANPIRTITKDVQVGIYENCEYVARIHKDKIILVTPYVKWAGNSGGYAEKKDAIRDQKVIDAVLLDLKDDCEDSAWSKIGRHMDDEFLANANF